MNAGGLGAAIGGSGIEMKKFEIGQVNGFLWIQPPSFHTFKHTWLELLTPLFLPSFT